MSGGTSGGTIGGEKSRRTAAEHGVGRGTIMRGMPATAAPGPWIGLNLSPLSWSERTGISSYVEQLLKAYRVSPERCGALEGFVYSRHGDAKAKLEAEFGRPVRSLKMPERALFRLFHLPGMAGWGMSGLRVYHETSLYTRSVPRGCRLIYTLYDVLPLIRPEWYSPFAVREYKAAFKRAARAADRIIVQSMAARRDALEAAPELEGKLVTVPNGVNVEKFRPDISDSQVASALAALGIERPYILFTGAIQPRKNVDGLLKAFLNLAAEMPHNLVLAGPLGWRGDEIRDALHAGTAAGRVRRLGFVPAPLLPALYRGADLYVFPSRGEGFGLTVLEAMACGVPVVASSVSATAEVAGDAALLVHPDDAEGLAAAIRRGIEDKSLRRDLIARGLDRSREFSWSRTADRTWDLYETLKEQA